MILRFAVRRAGRNIQPDSTVFWRLSFVFILISTLELLGVWIFSAGLLGKIAFLLLAVCSGILGALVVKRQGRRHWNELNHALDLGRSPSLALMNGGLVLLGALLLILPGLISDVVGLILFIPPLRYLVASHLRLRFEASRTETPRAASAYTDPQPNQSDVIDIE